MASENLNPTSPELIPSHYQTDKDFDVFVDKENVGPGNPDSRDSHYATTKHIGANQMLNHQNNAATANPTKGNPTRTVVGKGDQILLGGKKV